ncbi:MAG: hypothetical protein ACOYW9_05555 [Deinococcota bacterium]|nr:hypothetical protein [Allomeiothermus silvanus]
MPRWVRLRRGVAAAFAPESPWAARLAVLVIVGLQWILDKRYTFGPNWLLPGLELALLLPLSLVTHLRPAAERLQRRVAIGLIGLINLANLYSLLSLVRSLLHGSKASGTALLLNALNIWVTNLIIFALWYWELDRGGPFLRRSHRARNPDFFFPQMTNPELAHPNWRPGFVDYLFLSFTNATAFSPTDTLPLTPTAKLLMMVQAGTSFITVALVAARAVNILA